MHRLTGVVLVAGLACLGCDSGSSTQQTQVAPPPQPLQVETLIEGSQPALPKPLRERIELGEEPSPKIASSKSLRVPRYEDPFEVQLDAQGRVLAVSYPGSRDLAARAEAAWGPGIAAEDATNEYTVWLNAAAGTRVLVDDKGLHWTRYVPVSEFLGDGKGIVAFEPTQGTLLGLTRQELERNYGPVTSPSAENTELLRVAADRGVDPEFMGLIAGRLGMPSLDFPATEYADVVTKVHVGFDAEEKVNRVWFEVPYGSHPTAAAEILRLAATKWLDEPPPADPDLGNGPAEFSMSENPTILMHTTAERTWQIHIPAPPEPGKPSPR